MKALTGQPVGLVILCIAICTAMASAALDEGSYLDMNIAELGEKERAKLKSIEGKWKRPLYAKPDAGLEITLPKEKPCEHAFAFKIN